ncbi:MAG: hypothetical protein KY464_10680 [Gemmatimonadetes bacterium]|nr:hypothetical protein [Gemmatimonadota bacterium]
MATTVCLPPPSPAEMNVFFVACAIVGACVLVAQVVLGAFGLDAEAPELDVNVGDALDLWAVRPISAAVAFLGVAGLGALSAGFGSAVATILGLLAGIIALAATAFLTRQVMALESDGSLRITGAVGASATVYLPIPAAERGAGKVQLALQGRTVELLAVTRENEPLPRGTQVIVVSVVDPDTVEVLPSSSIEEVLHGSA